MSIEIIEQCPATGQDIRVRYASGRLTAEPTYEGVHYEEESMYPVFPEAWDEDRKAERLAELVAETKSWCRRVSGRVRDAEEARERLIRHGFGYIAVRDIHDEVEV